MGIGAVHFNTSILSRWSKTLTLLRRCCRWPNRWDTVFQVNFRWQGDPLNIQVSSQLAVDDWEPSACYLPTTRCLSKLKVSNYAFYVRDGDPCIGAVPGVPGLFMAAGHSCWGILQVSKSWGSLNAFSKGPCHWWGTGPADTGRQGGHGGHHTLWPSQVRLSFALWQSIFGLLRILKVEKGMNFLLSSPNSCSH